MCERLDYQDVFSSPRRQLSIENLFEKKYSSVSITRSSFPGENRSATNGGVFRQEKLIDREVVYIIYSLLYHLDTKFRMFSLIRKDVERKVS